MVLQHLENFDSFKMEYKIDPHCSEKIVSLGHLEFETVTVNRRYQDDDIKCEANETKTLFFFTECCAEEGYCPNCNRCLCSGCRLNDCDRKSEKVKLKYLTMKGLDTVESLLVEASGFTKTAGLFLQNLGKIFLVL